MSDQANQTQDLLAADLNRLGLGPADRVLMHLSFRSLGPVAGGAEAFISGMERYFGAGLLVLPALSWDLVNHEQPEFHIVNTPSCVGAIPELFRKRPGVIRSAHPTHSLAGKGQDAARFLAGQELFDTPCNPQSAYGRLPEERFWILLVGVNLTSCTAIHCIEEVAAVPNRLTPDREALFVTFADGRRVASPQHRHINAPSQHYGRAEAALRASGALRAGHLLAAPVLLIRAEDLFDGIVPLLRENPQLFG